MRISFFVLIVALAGRVSFPAEIWAATPLPEDVQTCLECHGEADFEMEKDGKNRSLHVDSAKFSKSIHLDLSCTGCHPDLEGELPHKERADAVNCGMCHQEKQEEFDKSLHGTALAKGDKLAPTCASCHGKHDILAMGDPDSSVAPIRIPFVCGSCHKEGGIVSKQRDIHQHNILKNFSLSIHGEGLLNKGLSVSASCASCHTSHKILPHTDKDSTIARDNIVKTCTQCHKQIERVHRKVIKGELWETNPGVIPVCVECHQPHKARKIFYDNGMATEDCLRCHKKSDLKRKSNGKTLAVHSDKLAGSVHSKIACAQCHTGVSPSKRRSCETVIKKVDCSICHSDQVDVYQKSTHGKLQAAGDKNAPWCTDCHGDHDILGKRDPLSPTFPIKVPELCASCHKQGGKAALSRSGGDGNGTGHGNGEVLIAQNYTQSIHGKGLLKSGLTVTAMCTNCHTPHGELPAEDGASTVHRDNIAKTCSQCHHGIYEEFSQSIHAKSQGKDGQKPPVCSTCHSAHTIKRTDQSNFKLDIMNQCGNCHEDVAKTYFDTYHGKVSQLGYAKTAKCHDCHGAHGIYAIDDPRSSLSRKNIVNTCKACHPGAQKKFAGYLTHSTHHDPKKYPIVFWTFWAMTSLLVGTFLIFGIHTLLWLPRSLAMRREHPPEKYDAKRKQYRRFTALQSIQHVVMILSFMTLAATGMTLKFSYAAWAQLLSKVLGGFQVMGFLHRVAAVMMFLLFISHLWDLWQKFRKEPGGWKEFLFGPNTMIPTLRDGYEVIGTLKWYLGLGKQPRYGRWTYWEKFDYFAVFWGIMIIGSSGIALWFPEEITRVFPGWIINVATIIHSDEALLASGFIFTIHFFNTHFRPEKFPMDTVVFTGRMSLEEFKRERPEEYAAVEKSGELEKHIVYPLPKWAIRLIRIFAWSALIIGSSLVLAIIYTMLFTYR